MEDNKFDKTMLDEILISNYKDDIDYDIAKEFDIDIEKDATEKKEIRKKDPSI